MGDDDENDNGKIRNKKTLPRFTRICPPNEFAVARLIEQAARLRVRLDRLWKDLQKTERRSYFHNLKKHNRTRGKRPSARLFTATDKNYQSIIKQLNELTPPSVAKSKLSELMDDE